MKKYSWMIFLTAAVLALTSCSRAEIPGLTAEHSFEIPETSAEQTETEETAPIPPETEYTTEPDTTAPAASETEPSAEDSTAETETTVPTAETSVSEAVTSTPPQTVPVTTTPPALSAAAEEIPDTVRGYADGEGVPMDMSWEFAGNSKINSGEAVMYIAQHDRKNAVVAVNAGHGTKGGSKYKTLCHPDGTPKVTGGTTGAGATEAIAVSTGMDFDDGTEEKVITLRSARFLRDALLEEGFDVLMIRDGKDVQLDNVARTVLSNNMADCHIAIHWDGDGLTYDKGAFYVCAPPELYTMYPVSTVWRESDRLGACVIRGLTAEGVKIYGSGRSEMDLTQISYSSIPSIDLELGNQSSVYDDDTLRTQAEGIARGVKEYFGY